MNHNNSTAPSDTTEKSVQKIEGVSIRLIVVVFLFLLSLAAFYYITDEVVLEKETGFDTYVFHQLDKITTPTLTSIMAVITFFGSSTFLLPAYIIITGYFLFLRRKTQLSLNVVAIGLTSTAVLFLLKSIFHRARPAHPLIKKLVGFSFPSGHTFSAFTFFGLLIYIVWKSNLSKPARRTICICMFAFACLIGFSRVYLHAHYATDAIGAFCLAIIWLTFSSWLLSKLTLPKKWRG